MRRVYVGCLAIGTCPRSHTTSAQVYGFARFTATRVVQKTDLGNHYGKPEGKMPQYLTERESKLWGFSKNLSNEQNVKILLGKMAIYRQAARLDVVTLEAYAQALVDLDLRAFQVAMRNLSCSERAEGETAFPSLGTILAEMENARERWPSFSVGAKEINDTPVFDDQPVGRLTA